MKNIKKDGNCLFRCLSHQLFGSEEHHLSVRFLLQRIENLNTKLFEKYLTPLNKPTIDEHVHHVGIPTSWGTHIELMAAATYFQICVYYTTQNAQTNEFRWMCIKPLKSLSEVRLPSVIDGPPAEITLPHHFELAYETGFHYDSIVLKSTNTVSGDPPPINVNTADTSCITIQ